MKTLEKQKMNEVTKILEEGKYKNSLRLLKYGSPEELKKIKELDHSIKKYSETIIFLEGVQKILDYNSEAAFVKDYMYKIIDILKKYDNKKIGVKTEEKIKNDLRSIGLNIFIDTRTLKFYIDGVTSYQRPSHTMYDNLKFFNSEGKSDFSRLEEIFLDFLDNHAYIENVDKHLKTQITKTENIVKKVFELENLLKDYNDFKRGEFSSILLGYNIHKLEKNTKLFFN